MVDFGTVASIGSMTYGATQITATIPSATNPGTVYITVTTPAGTSKVSANDDYTYTGGGTATSPAMTSANHTRSQPPPGCSTSRRPGHQQSARSLIVRSVVASRRHSPPASRSTKPGARRPLWTGRRRPVMVERSRSASPPPTAWGPVATQVFTLTVHAPAAPPAPAPTPPSPVNPPAPQHGYWLVSSDGASSPSALPSSTVRPARCICSGPSSASRRPRTAAGTGWSPRAAAFSPSAMPATTDPFRGVASTPPAPASSTV